MTTNTKIKQCLTQAMISDILKAQTGMNRQWRPHEWRHRRLEQHSQRRCKHRRCEWSNAIVWKQTTAEATNIELRCAADLTLGMKRTLEKRRFCSFLFHWMMRHFFMTFLSVCDEHIHVHCMYIPIESTSYFWLFSMIIFKYNIYSTWI